METPDFVLTHFYRRSPDPRLWIQANFITRKKNEENIFYMAFQRKPFDNEKITRDLDNGSLMKLPISFSISPSESVWIGPDQTIYIANTTNPYFGEIRTVYRDNVSSVYDMVDYCLSNIIENPSDKDFKEELYSFISREHWKTLTDILVKYLKSGKITEDSFQRVGFLLPVLNNKFGNEFTLLLNDHDMAYSDNGQVRFQLKWGYVRWKVKLEETPEIIEDLAKSPIYSKEDAFIQYFEEAEIG